LECRVQTLWFGVEGSHPCQVAGMALEIIRSLLAVSARILGALFGVYGFKGLGFEAKGLGFRVRV